MSRNGSGTYTLPSGNPVVSGTLIEASWANTTLSDLASAMTDSLSRSGQGGMTAALRLFDGTSSVPGLAWGSETTTGWYRAGAGDMRLVITGSQVIQYLATGVAITGTLSASGNTTVGGTLAVTGAATFSGQTVTLSNSTAFFPQLINRNTTSDANASYLVLDKIRGSSVVQNGDVLGNLVFRGFDGTQYLQGAYINAIVNAAPGTNDMPAALTFGVTADGGSGPSEQMRLTSTGLGIGTSSPGAKLEVAGRILQSVTSASIYQGFLINNFDAGGAGSRIDFSQGTSNVIGSIRSYFSSGWRLSLGATSAGDALNINASNDLGIGVTPQARLNVQYTDSAPSSSSTMATGVVLQYNPGGVAMNLGSSSSGYVYFNSAYANNAGVGAAYRWYQGATQAMTLNLNGDLLVGTTGSFTGQVGEKLVVHGPQTGGGGSVAYVYNTSSSGADASPALNLYKAMTTTSSSARFMQFYANSAGTPMGGIVGNGASNVQFASLSDAREKTNITPINGSLAKIVALNPVEFDWISNGEHCKAGFVAQDVEQVFPEFVVENMANEGQEARKGLTGGMTGGIVAHLVKAIQEQQAIINQLKADVAALKGA